MSKKNKIYSDAERLSILTDYYSSGMSQLACVRKYELSSINLLKYWIGKYETEFALLSLPSESEDTCMCDIVKGHWEEEKTALQKRVRELEKALAYSKLETLSRDVLIDKAEDYYNISIRKKSGVKQ